MNERDCVKNPENNPDKQDLKCTVKTWKALVIFEAGKVRKQLLRAAYGSKGQPAIPAMFLALSTGLRSNTRGDTMDPLCAITRWKRPIRPQIKHCVTLF